MVEVMKTEEKGSDVNLATYLLLDAFRRDYRFAVVVSNDSDLTEPIRVVREELGFPVGVLNPYLDTKKLSQELKKVAAFYKRVRVGVLEACQFPSTLSDEMGTISRPKQWSV
jgi:hypothetical protein